MTDPVTLRHHHLPVIRILGAQENPEQGGLAMPIAAHQPQPLPRVQDEAHLVKQQIRPIIQGRISRAAVKGCRLKGTQMLLLQAWKMSSPSKSWIPSDAFGEIR
mgnify:CR=1 FL=1